MESTKESTDEVAEAVAGLRELADFIETNPQFVEALQDARFLQYVTSESDFPALVSQLGGNREKNGNDDYFGVSRYFGAIELHVFTNRGQVCERVQTGTETVEVEEVITPAVTRTVTVERPVLEWVCAESVLAPREQVSA